MASTNFKLFDENKTNMMSDTEYNINTQRLNGVQAGIASSQLQNKTLYQTSLVAYSLAQIMMQNGYDANDSAAVSAFVGNMSNSLLQKVLDKATSAEAQNGINNTKWMTPALTKAAIDILAAKSQNILSDSTKTLYGLGSSAVPNDVLAELGKYKQYWWRRRTPSKTQYVEKQNNVTAEDSNASISSNGTTVSVSTSISFDPNTGENLTMVNPESVRLDSWNSVETGIAQISKITNKSPCYLKVSSVTPLIYLPAGSTTTKWSGGNGTMQVRGNSSYTVYFGNSSDVPVIAKVVSTVLAVIPASDWQYLRSSNRNAYPDSGIQGGYEYEYLGIPFDNAVTVPKIETGSYIGTGTYGSSSPNSLTFGFVPKFFSVGGLNITSNGYVESAGRGQIMLISNGGLSTGYGNGNTYYKIEGKTISWYNDNSASQQFNTSGGKYSYIAIG